MRKTKKKDEKDGKEGKKEGIAERMAALRGKKHKKGKGGGK